MQMAIMQCPVCGFIATHKIDFHHCPVCKSPVDLFFPFSTLCARGNWDEKSIIMIMEMAETGGHDRDQNFPRRQTRDGRQTARPKDDR
jgi:hypothetical protein